MKETNRKDTTMVDEAGIIAQDVTTEEDTVTSMALGEITRIRIAGKNMVLSEAKQLDKLELSPTYPEPLFSTIILGRLNLPYSDFKEWKYIGMRKRKPVLIQFDTSFIWCEAYRVFAKYAEHCTEEDETVVDKIIHEYCDLDNRRRSVGASARDVLDCLIHNFTSDYSEFKGLALTCMNIFNRYRKEYCPEMKEITVKDVAYFPYIWLECGDYECLSKLAENWDQFKKLRADANNSPLVILGGR